MIQLAREKGSKAVADQMFPKMMFEQTPQTKPAVASKLRTIMESQTPRTIENALVAMRDRPDVTKDLPSIPVSTLIVVGEHDAITPPGVSEAMNKAIRNPTMVIIKRAGHMSPMEQAEDMTTALRRFVEGVCAK